MSAAELQRMHAEMVANIAHLTRDQHATYALVRRYAGHAAALDIAVLRVGQRVMRSGYSGVVRELHLTGVLAGLVEVRLAGGDVIVPACELVAE